MDEEDFYETMRKIVFDILGGDAKSSSGKQGPNSMLGIENAPKVVYNGSYAKYDISKNITSGYGPRWNRLHSGIDIGLPKGTPIQYLKKGTVIKAANNPNGYGWYIVIQADGEDSCILLGHLSAVNVKKGDTVQPNDIVAAIGGVKNEPGAGKSTGAHLHYEHRVKVSAKSPTGIPINPTTNNGFAKYVTSYIQLLKP
jgi:murein DD-endopeptidase MepM/ murein hydrolase activator NlpD